MKRPVFVDHTGRRRRVAIVLGSGLGVVLVIGLIVLTAGLVTGAPLPLPGWPDAAHVDDGVAPTPVPAPAPGRTSVPKKTTTPTTATSAAATGPGNGNGNGHGRPSKTPGKP
ncbi:hypothetical protein Rhe02_57080 [Rhizocola hellebori]|uniref:Uncharacterized protein n=1 Tax=Rhizocola hellebori TaxID=1392758 RepID=A0A8J3QE43_9ACTN|nr:hypothetical protein [Rhizocola hellebori]GIH07641.1 hypothetical protein Rhe02_57080 [Rhizocola hellebori]